ncbi:hypothetical protein B481_0207 [Planococcus halocryophilus Or1]|uniref:Uncharacterized protein n=1 Tax=Planococcus halocryophilus TaxID=1215089 RepID=A0A1C7DVT6_9BACL|nr:hypothetical protein [Planococcus halocryophilus]ANU15522.1 hypothetical protein BBI08_11465 [Planococcus halocryophilus]EMF48091.1 hypothetical protein B481_0207 [Planococcus halocryophilus Or1]
MSEKKLSKEQIVLLKQIVDREKSDSSKEVAGSQNVEYHDTYEAFGRAIINQIRNEAVKSVESFGNSTDEIVLDTQITLIPTTLGMKGKSS